MRTLANAPLVHRCPLCDCSYAPTYPSKLRAFASGDAEAREQFISGRCEDNCWAKALAPEEQETNS